MPLITVKSEEDYEKLKKLAASRQELFKQNIENKIEKQTFDEELAERFAPLTISQEQTQLAIKDSTDVQRQTLQAIEDQRELLENTIPAIGSTTTESLPPTIITTSINKDVILGLTPLLNENNKALKLTPIKNTNQFVFGNTSVKLENDNMIFHDGTTVELNLGIMSALTNKDYNWELLNQNDLNGLYIILNNIGYDPQGNPDRKSQRADHIKQLFNAFNQPIQNVQYYPGNSLQTNYHTHQGSPVNYSDQYPQDTFYQTSDTGENIQGRGFLHTFLSSDPNELLEKLNILIEEKQAGNDNIQSEATAILDELLRQKVLTKEQHQNILTNQIGTS